MSSFIASLLHHAVTFLKVTESLRCRYENRESLSFTVSFGDLIYSNNTVCKSWASKMILI